MKIVNCILMNLSMGHWDANGLDVAVSKEVAAAKAVTDARMCRLRKSLVPANTPELKALTSTMREARTFHYENTHAWAHEGPRILTRGNYDEYMRKMLLLKSEFDANVLNFCDAYPKIMESAETVLGKLFNKDDYPRAEDIKNKYYYRMLPQPMPSAESLLSFGLDPADAEAARADLELSVSETFTSANKKMWLDLEGKLVKLRDKLAEEGGYVMDPTIDNVRKFATLFPRVNLTGDTDLDRVCFSLLSCLEGTTALKLKLNPAYRARISAEISSIYATEFSSRKPAKTVTTSVAVSRELTVA